MATLRDLTDLNAYREAVGRYECAECGIDEGLADRRLWGDGDYATRLSGGHCLYCHQDVPDAVEVPGVGDDAAWAALATTHNPECAWILTRAHRREA